MPIRAPGLNLPFVHQDLGIDCKLPSDGHNHTCAVREAGLGQLSWRYGDQSLGEENVSGRTTNRERAGANTARQQSVFHRV